MVLFVVAVVFVLMVVLVVLVDVVAVVVCWWYGCHITHSNVVPAFSVKSRRGRGDDNSPADGEDGMHCKHLDDMACRHVVACTLHCPQGPAARRVVT